MFGVLIGVGRKENDDSNIIQNFLVWNSYSLIEIKNTDECAGLRKKA